MDETSPLQVRVGFLKTLKTKIKKAASYADMDTSELNILKLDSIRPR
jgi:hypothetical protein